MRTTLDIDDDILEMAKSIARERNLSVGAVLSEFARRGLQRATALRREREGSPVFDISDDGTPLAFDRVKRYENET